MFSNRLAAFVALAIAFCAARVSAAEYSTHELTFAAGDKKPAKGSGDRDDGEKNNRDDGQQNNRDDGDGTAKKTEGKKAPGAPATKAAPATTAPMADPAPSFSPRPRLGSRIFGFLRRR